MSLAHLMVSVGKEYTIVLMISGITINMLLHIGSFQH